MNQFSALFHFLPRQFLTITRESILSCPALSTMFPGRLAHRFRNRRGTTKPQRLACAGCTAVSVCTPVVLRGLKAKREVVDSRGDQVLELVGMGSSLTCS